MKFEYLVGSLEAHELWIVETRGVQESIQALQAQVWKKHGGSNKIKGKFKKSNGKKGSWPNSQKIKNDEKLFESFKRGGGASNHKAKVDKKSMQCYNCEKWDTWSIIVSIRKEKELQRINKVNGLIFLMRSQLIMKLWCSWLQFQMITWTPKPSFLT